MALYNGALRDTTEGAVVREIVTERKSKQTEDVCVLWLPRIPSVCQPASLCHANRRSRRSHWFRCWQAYRSL